MIKIADIVFDLILEEIRDKKLLSLINVWFGAQPTDIQRAEGEYLIEKYVELKNSKRLGPQLSQIKRFKRKFGDFKDEDLTETDKSILLAFDKKKADDRKEWLKTYDEDLNIDINNKRVTFSDFVNKELIHFSHSDNIRSIPDMTDGLKPSQRKILFSAFKRKLTR